MLQEDNNAYKCFKGVTNFPAISSLIAFEPGEVGGDDEIELIEDFGSLEDFESSLANKSLVSLYEGLTPVNAFVCIRK